MYPTNRPDDQGAPRTYPERQRPLTGRHRRPADGRPGSEGSPGRRLDRIAAAEQSLRDAQRALVGSGSDPDVVGLAFAIARDCLAEAKDCSELTRRELALARVERAEAQQRLDSAPSPARPAEPVNADAAGRQQDSLARAVPGRRIRLIEVAPQCGQGGTMLSSALFSKIAASVGMAGIGPVAFSAVLAVTRNP